MTKTTHQNSIKFDVENILKQKLQRVVESSLKRGIIREVDAAMGKLFPFIANQIQGGSNFAGTGINKGWKPYSAKYKTTKLREKGHLRWFLYTGELAEEFSDINEQRFISAVGNTKVTFSRDKTKITVNVAPRIRILNNKVEAQLSNVLSSEALEKLSNRDNAYRALIGPALRYFMRVRVPAALKRGLGAR